MSITATVGLLTASKETANGTALLQNHAFELP